MAIAAGAAITVAGAATGSHIVLGVAMAMLGLGIGISAASVQAAAISAAPVAQAGAAAGLYSTSRYLGSVLGSTVLAIVFAGTAAGGESSRYIALLGGLVAVSIGGLLVNARLEPFQGITEE